MQEELKKEEEALKAYATTRSGLDAELTEARRRASLTEFERFMEDLNAKRTQEQTDYERKKLQLEEQVKQEETNLEREKVVYLAKRQIYIETQTKFQQFHDAYKKNLENMNLATQRTSMRCKEARAIANDLESDRVGKGGGGRRGHRRVRGSVRKPDGATHRLASIAKYHRKPWGRDGAERSGRASPCGSHHPSIATLLAGSQ